MLSTILIATVLVGIVGAQRQSAMALTPSNDWYGVDGNWSTIRLQVGMPGQSVNVLASTSLSEFWAIGAGGCLASNVFTVADSKSWNPLGAWQLGLDYLGYGGNGDYGLDTLSTTLLTGDGMRMDNIITASINSTDYYLGYLGLGVTKGSFGNQVAESPLSQAVKNYGWIPSYSYGYTAGAYYITLGGYDASRFVQHNNEFSLDPSDGLPHALVRGIEVSTGQDKALPGGWNTSTRILSNMSTSFTAMIDSSTPYLWLPDAVCDQFAEAFNLTYNSTFNLYTPRQQRRLWPPLTVPGVVNITITAAAFAQVLRYPFQGETIKYGEPAVPYFPLRRASNLTDTFIIGRSFLQEAYLITKYDTGVFSLHQALFPNEPLQSLQLKNIVQPSNSPFPPPAQVNLHGGLSTAQMGGIAAAAVAACVIMLVCWYFYRRQKKSRATTRTLEDGKDAASSIMPEPPRSPVAKMFTRILGKKKTQRSSPHEAMGSTSQPAEVGADTNHAVYELPVPVNPAELDGDDGKSVLGHPEFRTDAIHNTDAYELARRNVEIQLQGPVPAYTPPENPADLPPAEKSIQDMSPTRRVWIPAVVITDIYVFSIISHSLRQPVIDSWFTTIANEPPRREWTTRTSDLPSPLTEGPSSHSPAFADSNAGNTVLQPVSPESEAFTPSPSHFSNISPPNPPPALPASPLPTHRRAPMEFSNVICLGPLPENFSLPGPPAIPAPLARPQGSPNVAVPEVVAANRVSTDTLGSNWTEFEEELMARELTRQVSLPEDTRSREVESDSLRSMHRLDGSEFIHIPQPAERRFSWEH
ncbi:eukaryotic aspartyl protease [Colletotrichum tofieldiae]|nr:eukaryotic aspartyl protease [Colletotrichum tofieldiae]